MSNSKKLKLAMFGAGRIGDVHAKNIAENAALELAWICDPFIEGAQSLAGPSGARTTTSADDVFDDDSVAAIIIGSPTNTHIDLISRAQSQGLAVRETHRPRHRAGPAVPAADARQRGTVHA